MADLNGFSDYKGTEGRSVIDDGITFENPFTRDGKMQAENSLEKLIQDIKADPSGDYTLSEDLDTSGLNVQEAQYITEIFTGTLDGKGHTIYGLTKPFFYQVKDGDIKNITFQGER